MWAFDVKCAFTSLSFDFEIFSPRAGYGKKNNQWPQITVNALNIVWM